MTPLRAWLLWLAGFLFFPLAGVLSGRATALLAGVITGLVIGVGQSLLSAGRLDWRRWVPASTLGMGAGLALGGAAVGHRTGLGDLALMGAITGLLLGLAQTLALPAQTRRRWAWAVATPALWALGWTVTTLVGVQVDQQFSVFGSTGAITFSALSGLLLQQILPVHAVVSEVPA